MMFCTDHWEKLKEAISSKGLTVLVSETGEEVVNKLVDQTVSGETIDNFDPLIQAHNAIMGNSMRLFAEVGGDPIFMAQEHTDEPFLNCPICFLNLLSYDHDVRCTNKDCTKPKGITFDWMIERAAKDELDKWKSFGTV